MKHHSGLANHGQGRMWKKTTNRQLRDVGRWTDHHRSLFLSSPCSLCCCCFYAFPVNNQQPDWEPNVKENDLLLCRWKRNFCTANKFVLPLWKTETLCIEQTDVTLLQWVDQDYIYEQNLPPTPYSSKKEILSEKSRCSSSEVMMSLAVTHTVLFQQNRRFEFHIYSGSWLWVGLSSDYQRVQLQNYSLCIMKYYNT